MASASPLGDENIRHVEYRRSSVKERANSGSDRCGKRDGNERSRTILEKQQLDCEENCTHRTAERGCHTRCRACCEKRFSFVARDPNELSGNGAERTASCDDWAFCSERTARSYCDCRGYQLQEEHARGDSASTEQDILHDFRNSMSANCGRPVSRHDSDDQCADQWCYQYSKNPGICSRRIYEGAGDSSIERDVGDKPNERRENLCGETCADCEERRQNRDEHRATIGELVILRSFDLAVHRDFVPGHLSFRGLFAGV